MTRLAAVIFLAIVLAGAAQNTLAHRLTILGTSPDFLLVTAAIIGLLSGASAGTIAGALAGFFHASLAGMGLGTFLLSRTVVGFLVGSVKSAVFQENPVVPFTTGFIATILGEVLFTLFNPPARLAAWAISLPLTAVYNGAIAVPIDWLLRKRLHPKRKLRRIY